jgi:hypothetical protein
LRLVAGGWFVLREKYCGLVGDKPSEQTEQKQQGLTGLLMGLNIFGL